MIQGFGTLAVELCKKLQRDAHTSQVLLFLKPWDLHALSISLTVPMIQLSVLTTEYNIPFSWSISLYIHKST